MYIENLDLSEEANDVLEKQPKWITRYGTLLVFVIITLLILLTSIIRYNDVIKADVIVTSKNPPVNVIAKSNGFLTQINAEENKSVLKGDVLGVIKNNANFKDIKCLKAYLEVFNPKIKDFYSLNTILPPNLELGEIQLFYHNFRLRYQDYLNYMVLTPEKNQIENYSLQMISKKESLKNNLNSLEENRKQVENERKIFVKNKLLYEKGLISELEYINMESNYSKAKEKHQQLASVIQHEKENILISKNNLKQSSIRDKSLFIIKNQYLESSKQELINSLKSWEDKYVLSSPIDGKLTLFDVWNKYQDVNANEIIFTILPNELNGIIGRVMVPINNSGKVKSGQSVIVKLKNYPYQEWGKLKGNIISISSIPKEKTLQYTAIIELNSMKTSYNKIIDFKQKMEGEVEIIVEEITLLERLLYPMKDFFD